MLRIDHGATCFPEEEKTFKIFEGIVLFATFRTGGKSFQHKMHCLLMIIVMTNVIYIYIAFIPANMATTHPNAALVISEGSRLSLKLLLGVVGLGHHRLFSHRATFRQFPCLGQLSATVLHCRSVWKRFSLFGYNTPHNPPLGKECSLVHSSAGLWWSIDGGRSVLGENYTKISLRCCGAGGQGDRGEARSLAGGMN